MIAAGRDLRRAHYEASHVPPITQAAPKRYDGRAQHNHVPGRRPQGDDRT